MNGRRLLAKRTFWGLVLAAAFACKPDRTPAGPADAASATVAARATEEPSRVLPMKKVPILVGGCGLDCAEPALSAMRFLQALASGEDPDRVAAFLDTTQLMLDGRPLGQEWARLWQEMRAATRKDSIRETVADLQRAWRTLTREQVAAALASGVQPVRVWATEAVYDIAGPGGRWRMTLRPRGIEWLVTGLDRSVDSTDSKQR